jgi:hypothetical protein
VPARLALHVVDEVQEHPKHHDNSDSDANTEKHAQKRSHAFEQFGTILRVPETRIGVSERVLARSSGDDLMLLLAV